jgi:hypothetical protein
MHSAISKLSAFPHSAMVMVFPSGGFCFYDSVDNGDCCLLPYSPLQTSNLSFAVTTIVNSTE